MALRIQVVVSWITAIPRGASFFRPLQFDFKRLDIAGGRFELCQRNAAMDVIRIALRNAERRGEKASLHLNCLSSLSYSGHPNLEDPLETLRAELNSLGSKRDNMSRLVSNLWTP